MDPACQPVILPARKVPGYVKEKFKAELQSLQDLDVIAPVDEPRELVVAVKKSAEFALILRCLMLPRGGKDTRFLLLTRYCPIKQRPVCSLTMSLVWCRLFATPHRGYRWLRLPLGFK